MNRPLGSLLVGALLLAGCSPAESGQSVTPQTPPASAIQRTLVLMAQQVPLSFTARGLGGTGTGLAVNIPQTIFNATLATTDGHGNPFPFLAQSLPQLNTENWRVFPDGTMETTYRLKPSLTWHDGHPLTAEDFVFAQEIYATPEYGVSTSLATRSRSEVLAPDSRTVLITWRQPFADANQLSNDLAPLPRHLLEKAHRDSLGAGPDSPAFLPNSTFWTSDYIGAGPYKVDVYHPGSSVEASAFDGYVLGRPIIDRVSIRGMADPNAALATMLSGEAHMSFDQLRGETGEILDRQWAATGGGTILWSITSQGGRGWFFQFRPEFAQPLELATDIRVRRAIASAIEREPMFQVAANGRGVVSDTFTNPKEPEFGDVQRAVETQGCPESFRAGVPVPSRRPETRWAGSAGNRHGFSNPDYNRLVEAFEVSLEASERTRLKVEMEKMVLQHLPTLYTWIEGVPFAHVAALKGPQNRWNTRGAAPGRNIHEWYWES